MVGPASPAHVDDFPDHPGLRPVEESLSQLGSDLRALPSADVQRSHLAAMLAAGEEAGLGHTDACAPTFVGKADATPSRAPLRSRWHDLLDGLRHCRGMRSVAASSALAMVVGVAFAIGTTPPLTNGVADHTSGGASTVGTGLGSDTVGAADTGTALGLEDSVGERAGSTASKRTHRMGAVGDSNGGAGGGGGGGVLLPGSAPGTGTPATGTSTTTSGSAFDTVVGAGSAVDPAGDADGCRPATQPSTPQPQDAVVVPDAVSEPGVGGVGCGDPVGGVQPSGVGGSVEDQPARGVEAQP